MEFKFQGPALQGHYSNGVVGGLKPSVADSKLVVSEGFAIDSKGREIYYDGSVPPLEPLPTDTGTYYLTMCYSESKGDKEKKRITECASFAFYAENESFDESIDLVLVQFTIESSGTLSPTLDSHGRINCRNRLAQEV